MLKWICPGLKVGNILHQLHQVSFSKASPPSWLPEHVGSMVQLSTFKARYLQTLLWFQHTLSEIDPLLVVSHKRNMARISTSETRDLVFLKCKDAISTRNLYYIHIGWVALIRIELQKTETIKRIPEKVPAMT